MGVQGDSAVIVRASGSGIEIESDNEDELVAALTRLKDNPADYDALCQSGRTFVQTHYTRDRLASEYLEILNAVKDGTPVVENE